MARISSALAWAWILVMLAGCPSPERPYPAPKVEREGKVIARIGPVALTTSEIEKRIRQQSPFIRVQLKDPNKMKLFVEEQVRNEVLAQEAWRKKLYDDPVIQAELRRAMIQKMMKDHVEAEKDQNETSESELLTAYKQRIDEFNKPEKIRLSQIVRFVDDDKERKEGRKLLETVERQIVEREKKNEPHAFAESARQYSEDENTKNGGGDLQFMTSDQLAERYGKAVAEQMFTAVDIGAMAIVDAPNAVVLFKKTGKRKAVEQTLEQVKPKLRGSLIGEKRTRAFEAFVEDLKKKQGVTVDQEAISTIKVDMNSPTDPGAVKEAN